jgi:ribonuclease HII
VSGVIGFESELRGRGFRLVAGADEAGRGACAGPLVAAAVILPDGGVPGLRDSKQLTAAARERLYGAITSCAVAWACAEVPPADCDALGMQEADLRGLRLAITRLDPAPDFALTDGFAVPGLPCPSLAVWKGDKVAACVAAASIVAKVTRDRLMAALAEEWPGYGFERHKGYCTAAHDAAIARLGACPAHRTTYDNVRRACARLEAS